MAADRRRGPTQRKETGNMLPEFIKPWGLKLISAGLKAPENPLDRFIEFTLLKKLLAKLEINCVLDVGENDGQFARNLRNI